MRDKTPAMVWVVLILGLVPVQGCASFAPGDPSLPGHQPMWLEPSPGTELSLYGGPGDRTYLGCLWCPDSHADSLDNPRGRFRRHVRQDHLQQVRAVRESEFQLQPVQQARDFPAGSAQPAVESRSVASPSTRTFPTLCKCRPSAHGSQLPAALNRFRRHLPKGGATEDTGTGRRTCRTPRNWRRSRWNLFFSPARPGSRRCAWAGRHFRTPPTMSDSGRYVNSRAADERTPQSLRRHQARWRGTRTRVSRPRRHRPSEGGVRSRRYRAASPHTCRGADGSRLPPASREE